MCGFFLLHWLILQLSGHNWLSTGQFNSDSSSQGLGGTLTSDTSPRSSPVLLTNCNFMGGFHAPFLCLDNLLEWLTELKRRFCLLLLVYYKGYCQLKWKPTVWDLWVSVLLGVLLRTIAWGQPLRKLLIEVADISSSTRLLLVMRCRYLNDFSTFLSMGRCMKLGWENFLENIGLKSYSANFSESQSLIPDLHPELLSRVVENQQLQLLVTSSL